MRHRRYFTSNALYELCFRAKEGLPFPTLRIINLIIKSALARAQRDNKVILTHHLWMGNHMHALVVIKDALQATRFYGEVQKQITDSIKRLLGLSYLNLWERRIMVARILDITKAKERIEYLYLNPARASLVNSIEEYPGVSSWNSFSRAPNTLSAVDKESVAWIRLPTIQKLPSPLLQPHQDRYFSEELLEASKIKHELEIHPNAWMAVLGVTDPKEIEEINNELHHRIKTDEARMKSKRDKEGKKAVGPARLKEEPILKPHTPKKKERRIYVLSSIIELRVAFINDFKELSRHCMALYKRVRRFESVRWPHGIFPPYPPQLANIFA